MEPMQCSLSSPNYPAIPTHPHGDKLIYRTLNSAQLIASEVHLQNLLKFISPSAKLTENPSLIEFFINGIRLRILNYTKVNFSFNVNFNLLADHSNVAWFTKEDCHIVAYQVEGSEAICIDNKKDSMDFPKSRITISKGTRHYQSYQEQDFENILAAPPISPKGGNTFLTTDPTMIELLNEMDPHANRDKSTLGIYLSRMDAESHDQKDLNIYRLTVLNYTDQKITFDIRRNFRINGKIFATFTPDDCQTIAYYLKDLSRKYIHTLIKDEDKPGFQKFTYIQSWQILLQRHLLCISQTNLLKKKQSSIKSNMILEKYMNNKSQILNEILKDNPYFLQLMPEISTAAIEILQPSIVESRNLNRCIRILNLTHQKLSFNKKQELHVNGLPVEIDKSDCSKFLKANKLHMIAYKVPNNLDIICLDFKEDGDSFPEERHFLKKDFQCYKFTIASSFSWQISDQSLFAIHPQSPDSSTAFTIAKNIIKLTRNRPVQNKPFNVSIFPSRFSKSRLSQRTGFAVINYSRFHVAIDVCKRIWIDNCFIKIDNEDPILIVSQSIYDPEIIYLRTASSEMSLKKNWARINSIGYSRLFETTHWERVYNNLWRGQYTKESCFSHLPRELIHKIAATYLELLNRSLDW